MHKATFEKAKEINKTLSLMEYMKKKITDTQSINELFNSALVAEYGQIIDNEFKASVWAIVHDKIEVLKQEFEQL